MGYHSEQPVADTLKLTLPQRLDINEIAKIWDSCINLVKNSSCQSLIIDLTQVNYCDSAGTALIKVLQRTMLASGKNCTTQNLQPSLKKLLNYADKEPPKTKDNPPAPLKFPANLGLISLNIAKNIRENIIFVGRLTQALCRSLVNPRQIRWGDFLRITEDSGPKAVPIVALIGFLIGLISTFQAAPSFGNFGMQIYMIDLVALGLVREMGPLLTAVLLAGRTASAFASELGIMKIDQEIDALKTMGLNPIQFLVVPRVLAVTLITPILECLFIIFGLLGCMTVMATLGYTFDAFFHRLYQAVSALDYFGGLIKVSVFGLVIASTGCLHGIKTSLGATALGRSTTQAVVNSLIMLVVTDGIFALIYYVLDI